MAKQLDHIMTGQARAAYTGYGFPVQTVSVEEKEKPQFKKACMDFMVQEARRQSKEKRRDLKKYQYLSDEFKYGKDHQWITDPMMLGDSKEEKYGATDEIQHYPIMNSPLNTIWGERINRNIEFYCLSESPESFNEYNKNKTELLLDHATSQIHQRALQRAVLRAQSEGIQISDEVLGQLDQQVQQMTAPEIQRYMDKDYVDTIEQSANRMLRNMWKTNNLDEEFIEGFRHATISGKEFYEIRVMNNNVSIKNINPFSVFFHKSPSERWISNGQYAGTRLHLTPSSIIDAYRDKLTVADIKHLEDKTSPSKGQGYKSVTGIKSISYDTQTYSDPWGGTFRDYNSVLVDEMVNEFMVTGSSSQTASTIGLIEVVHAYWKSYRKYGICTWYDENDIERKMDVDENYEPDEDAGESVEWFYLNQVYEGTIIDDDIMLGVEPYQHQIFDSDDPDYSPLPIEGCYSSEISGKSMGLVDLMMPWAEMYDIVAYELKRDMKKAIGKVMYMSIDHIPNIEGFDMDKWMYWCREFGIAWVGEGKKRTQFSHYSAQDMSFAEQINAKILLLDKLKLNCDAFAGFSPARVANATKDPTAQQSQMNIQNSVNQTEFYFWKHSQLIQRVLNNALNIGKKLAGNGKGYLRNLYDDMDQRYLETDGSKIRNARLGCFVVHGPYAIQRRETLRQMALSAAAKTGEALDMADVLMAHTENEIKQTLRELRRINEQKFQQQLETERRGQDMEAQDLEDEREWDKEKHYSKLASDERREYMRTFINQDDNLKDTDGDKIPDVLDYQELMETQADNNRKHQREMRKLQGQEKKDKRTLDLKSKELKIKERQIDVDLKNQQNDKDIARINARNRSKKTSS